MTELSITMQGTTLPFKAYGKTPRLFRNIVVTEKIDGTNAGVHIVKMPFGASLGWAPDYDDVDFEGEFPALVGETAVVCLNEDIAEDGLPTHEYWVFAQSRKRMITPAADNHGFANWVSANATSLVRALGEGTHFGEWYGAKLQGNPHGLSEKRWALFNVSRRFDFDLSEFDGRVHFVPVLYEGVFDEGAIDHCVQDLRTRGSVLGGKAEGVIIYHEAARQVFKVLCENDEIPKTLVA